MVAGAGAGQRVREWVWVLKGSSGIPMEMGMSPLVTGGRDTKCAHLRNCVEPRGVTQTSETGNLKVRYSQTPVLAVTVL